MEHNLLNLPGLRRILTKVDDFSKDTKKLVLLQKTFHVVQSHYVTLLSTLHYKSFSHLLLNQGHHPNIHCNTTLFHVHAH